MNFTRGAAGQGYEERRKGELLGLFRELITRALPCAGKLEAVPPSLWISRIDEPTLGQYCLQAPIAALVVQGSKQMRINGRDHALEAGDVMTVSIESPSTSLIPGATPERPFLGIHFGVDIHIITDILSETPPRASGEDASSIHVSRAPLDFLETLFRLAQLADRPLDIPGLAPLILRELHYLLLAGPQGGVLRALYARGARDTRIVEAIAFLKHSLDRSVAVEELARAAHMSVSSLHRQFKRLTGESPLQYHKKLRLIEAQRRMLAENERADIAAMAVGYESITQFNREYKRLFGAPPLRDARSRKRQFER